MCNTVNQITPHFSTGDNYWHNCALSGCSKLTQGKINSRYCPYTPLHLWEMKLKCHQHLCGMRTEWWQVIALIFAVWLGYYYKKISVQSCRINVSANGNHYLTYRRVNPGMAVMFLNQLDLSIWLFMAVWLQLHFQSCPYPLLASKASLSSRWVIWARDGFKYR